VYTPTRIAEREAVFEFLRQKLRAYQIIYKDDYRCRLLEPVTLLNVALDEICFDVVNEAFLWTTLSHIHTYQCQCQCQT